MHVYQHVRFFILKVDFFYLMKNEIGVKIIFFGIYICSFVILPGRGLDMCCCLFVSPESQETLSVLQQLDSVILQ